MDNIVNLGSERDKRHGPAPDHCSTDDFGRPMFSYLLSYEMEGSQWSTKIWAYSAEDAANRVIAMRESLRCDGQIFTQIIA